MDPALSDLSGRFWEAMLETYPTLATLQGDRRFDDRIEDLSVEADARTRGRWAGFRAEAEAIDASGLTPTDRVTHGLLVRELTDAIAGIDLRLAELRADQMTGAHAELLMVAPQITAPTPETADALARRHRQIGTFLDQAGDRLRRGVAAGRTPARINVERSLNQVDKYLASPVESDPFVTLPGPGPVPGPARDGARDGDRDGNGDGAPLWAGEAAWREELTAICRDVIRPGFERYRDVMAGELLPAARSDDQPGLSWLPDGAELYDYFVRHHTTVDDLPAEAIHQIGLDELTRLAGEYADVGGRLFGTSDPAAIFDRLRTDPALRYTKGDEIMDDARRYLDAASAVMGQWFGRLPQSPCDIAEVPAQLADDVPAAYYFPPAEDGSRPGTYFVNTGHPEDKNRYETASIAFHEAIPGHHLQLAIATELPDLPKFQRLSFGNTAYVEGWGLYAERLADEMGLYTDDLERIGMLAADSWRSCRLVVDTGLHALGWTRRQAIDFMVANAPVGVSEIEVEVDRYIGMPGQALAYKVGQREILRLRADARGRLAGRFDIKAFHDTVLGQSSVSLPVLRRLVDDWVAAAPRGE